MSKLVELKKYLVGSDNSFLLNEAHNGKTIMLSGEWGVGKTFFWHNEIEPELSGKLHKKKKACVYVSLYGKDNIETIKHEILYKAYASFADKKEDELKKKAISAFGFGSRVLSSFSAFGISLKTEALTNAIGGFFEEENILKAEEHLSDGGVVCLDDFERKSNDINLNDLFGFISQLSIEMNCKVMVILNSNSFEEKEAILFKNVKEKTVSKFFNYTPTIHELFESIFDNNEHYKKLILHKEIILSAVKETEELNARVYIQVLDNCLEWIESGEDTNALRGLVLCTVNFVRNHFSFDTFELQGGKTTYKVLKKFLGYSELGIFLVNTIQSRKIGSDEIIHIIRSHINKEKKADARDRRSPDYYLRQNEIFSRNEATIQAFHHYLYVLKLDEGIDEELFKKVNRFVSSGIMP